MSDLVEKRNNDVRGDDFQSYVRKKGLSGKKKIINFPDLKRMPDDVEKKEIFLNLFSTIIEEHAEHINKSKIKRLMDIIISLLVVCLGMPFHLILCLIIKLDDSGKAVYVQNRIGRDGKIFRFHKYRSMTTNNDISCHVKFMQESYIKEYDEWLMVKKVLQLSENGFDLETFRNNLFEKNQNKTINKIENDPRITRVGSFIRKTSIDEFPQFFDVLLGKMSLVGPRPILDYEYEKYTPIAKLMLTVNQGITCTWQVCGRNKLSFEEQTLCYLLYIYNWSPMMDIKIFFMTFFEVFGKGGC